MTHHREQEQQWLAHCRDLWGENWCVARRRSAFTDSQYDRRVTPKEYNKAREQWECETFGGLLVDLETAAPALLAALRRSRIVIGALAKQDSFFAAELLPQIDAAIAQAQGRERAECS